MKKSILLALSVATIAFTGNSVAAEIDCPKDCYPLKYECSGVQNMEYSFTENSDSCGYGTSNTGTLITGQSQIFCASNGTKITAHTKDGKNKVDGVIDNQGSKVSCSGTVGVAGACEITPYSGFFTNN